MIRILIADDHAIVRGGLKEILVRQLKDVILGEAGDAQQALARLESGVWDLLILDITLPGRSGLDLLADLKQQKPEMPVLVLSMHPEDQYGKRVLQAGASGYMNKEAAPEDLVKAIRKILSGGVYVSTALAEKLASDLSRGSGRPLHELLSAREFEVMRMLASGKGITQIAEELRLGATTVSTYRARILEKMGMASTAELMRYAIDNRLVD
ncbi:MAG TPA: response regulator transcription factor [Candidatus Acidoferrales bacterium]|nr:response regulator transcription factor [Candidatus Acidoferrales bacterium]